MREGRSAERKLKYCGLVGERNLKKKKREIEVESRGRKFRRKLIKMCGNKLEKNKLGTPS